MTNDILLEICTDSPAAAILAEKAGADRIELCAGLDYGGITPSLGTIIQTLKSVSIPVHVLVRPREGDFCYTDKEFDQMLTDVEAIKIAGAHGIVTGILTHEGYIDTYRTKQLFSLAHPLQKTFHRAFDTAYDPLSALDDVITTGATRLLTSGQKITAIDGLGLIKQLVQKAEGRLIIMPGAGINPDNAALLVNKTGVREIHCTARRRIYQSYPVISPQLSFMQRDNRGRYYTWTTNSDKIKLIKERCTR